VLTGAYAYGHLVPATVALSMAIAFAVLGLRVRALRADLAYAACALLCAGTALASMVLALAPSLSAGRALFAVATLLYASIAVLWHAQFGEVLPPGRRRKHARVVAFAVAIGIVLAALLAAGSLDAGHLRPLPHGTALVAMPASSAAMLFAFALGLVAISMPVLGAAGPRARERRACLVFTLIAPPLCGHELLVAVGVIELPPVGAYVAGLASLQGVVVLSERFRALTRHVTLGPYRIEERLGAGGMAEVFVAQRAGKGRLAGIGQRVALKRLRPELAADPRVRDMILDEARTLARLSHPNIVGLHDVGVHDGDVFLALELVRGAALSTLLTDARARGVPLGPGVAVEIGVQAASALAWAHAQTDESGAPLGLVHRDVSPQNLLVDATGTVKLSDFGIARSLERHGGTTSGVVRGKVPYIAPERLRGESYDHRVDLFALGVVLYEATMGSLPFEAETEAGMMLRMLEGRVADVELLRAAAPDLAPIVVALLDEDPAGRPRDASDLRARLLPLRDEASGREVLGAKAFAVRPAEAPQETRKVRRWGNV
jgi:hypothetical protein